MSALNARPIIFPLSNPVHLCELDYQDAIAWYVIARSSLDISLSLLQDGW